jgi:phosphotransacetylase
VHPCDELSLTATLEAARAGLIEPVVVAPTERVRNLAGALQLDLGGVQLVDVGLRTGRRSRP